MSYYELSAEEKGYTYFERRPAIPTFPHFHGAYELVLQRDGEQEVLIGGEKRTIRGGEGCFSDSFCIHSYFPKPTANCFVIVGNKECFERIFAFYGGKKPPRFFPFSNFKLLENLFELCQKPFKDPQNGRATFESAMGILLASIAEDTPFLGGETDKQGELVCKVLGYAEERFFDDLSLLALAKKFGYSHEHLSRVLHKYLSENWNGYVGRLRARKANERLMTDPRANVLDVAFACGFDSANTFYRAYKKAFGKTPRREG